MQKVSTKMILQCFWWLDGLAMLICPHWRSRVVFYLMLQLQEQLSLHQPIYPEEQSLSLISWSLASGISLANSIASHWSTYHQASSCHHYRLHKSSLVHTKGALRRQDFLITPWYSPWGFASKGEWVQFRVVFFHLIHCWQFWRSHIPTWVLMGWCQYICKGSVIFKQWFSPVPCLIIIFG